ncbi:MAG: hypothetical protein IPF47_13025 [Gemmatimonadetes bacterium]|nr:hypothetical protein [Gemmatimonadota bacterium]
MAWFESRMHPEDRDGAAGLLAEAIRSQHEHCTRRYRFQRGDGTFAMVEGRAVIAWVNGIAERVIGSIADITVEQQVGEQLAIAPRMEAVGRLAGGVPHDLNNLLTAIRGFASFAMDEQLLQSRARGYRPGPAGRRPRRRADPTAARLLAAPGAAATS